MTTLIHKFGFRCLSLSAALLLAASAFPAQLPLASVEYFNPYQNPANWGGWGSAIYQGSGASVRNIDGTVPGNLPNVS